MLNIHKFEKVVDNDELAFAISMEKRNPESTEVFGKFNISVDGKRTIWVNTTSDEVAESLTKRNYKKIM